jgi:hypothetical protein
MSLVQPWWLMVGASLKDIYRDQSYYYLRSTRGIHSTTTSASSQGGTECSCILKELMNEGAGILTPPPSFPITVLHQYDQPFSLPKMPTIEN